MCPAPSRALLPPGLETQGKNECVIAAAFMIRRIPDPGQTVASRFRGRREHALGSAPPQSPFLVEPHDPAARGPTGRPWVLEPWDCCQRPWILSPVAGVEIAHPRRRTDLAGGAVAAEWLPFDKWVDSRNQHAGISSSRAEGRLLEPSCSGCV